MLKPICTATYTFQTLIERGCLYVDKTEFLWRMVSNPDGIFFLSRPRRFGKSLFLSTLDAFFSGKKELFKGLAIEKLAPEEWESYSVIRLDMASVSAPDVETLEVNLQIALQRVATSFGLEIVAPNAKTQFALLIDALVKKTDKQVVILVDEYDKPLLDVIGKPAANDILEHLRNFYQEIKSANDKERFVFITGVTKFAHTSLFSGMNNPTDITMSAEYATMLGYTQEELEGNFAEYIDLTASSMKMSREELLAHIKEWYDGFRFEEAAESMYNPVSIGNFFTERKFKNYWYETGTPQFLVEMAKKKPFNIDGLLNSPISLSLFDKYDINNLSPFAVLIQAGYVTIKKAVKDGLQQLYIMDYPNKEVRDCFKNFLFELYSGFNPEEAFRYTKNLSVQIETGNVDEFMELIQPIFTGLPYENIDKSKAAADFNEGYFRNVLATIFYTLNKKCDGEIQNSHGRIDLVVQVRDYAFIFELKMKKKGESIKKALASALEQATAKNYAEKYRNLSKHIKVIAVAFDASSRRLVGWKATEVQ